MNSESDPFFIGGRDSGASRAGLGHEGKPGVLQSWGHSIVHFSGLYRLARAPATGDAAVILQVFQNNGFASTPARE